MTEYSTSNEDQPRRQARYLKELLDKHTPFQPSGRALNEVLYTAQENNMLGDIESINDETALRIWALVNVSKKITDHELDQIRM
jgi:hypothetical protein